MRYLNTFDFRRKGSERDVLPLLGETRAYAMLAGCKRCPVDCNKILTPASRTLLSYVCQCRGHAMQQQPLKLLDALGSFAGTGE